jgi:hypothetical protein
MSALEAMAAGAEALDAEADAQAPEAVLAAQQQGQQVEQVGQTQGQLVMLIDMAVPVLGSFFPSLPDVYPPPVREAVAASLAPVLEKYGISLADWGQAYRAEIGALIVCGPVAYATVQAIKTDIAARAPKGDSLRQLDSTSAAAQETAA